MRAFLNNLMRSRKVRWAVGLTLAAVALFVVSIVVGGQYLCKQTAERSFVLDMDFRRIRRILMSTDANQQIITLTGDSQFLNETWTPVGGGINLNPLDPSWTLELRGDLHVRTLDEYVGREEIDLTQNVKIESKQLVSRTDLKRGSARLKGYNMVTRYVPEADSSKTRVEQRLTQEVLTHAPWFAHGIADSRVYGSAYDSLVRQEAAIRKVIDDNKDRWLLPIP
jgi:hypothetical protein